MNREQTTNQIIELIADIYGIDPDDLSPSSHLIEDVDIKGNLDEFVRFVHRLNRVFEIDLQPRDINVEDEDGIQTIADLVSLAEDAMLG
jgi:acyl carrier protein